MTHVLLSRTHHDVRGLQRQRASSQAVEGLEALCFLITRTKMRETKWSDAHSGVVSAAPRAHNTCQVHDAVVCAGDGSAYSAASFATPG
jgi:hypothetical protein